MLDFTNARKRGIIKMLTSGFGAFCFYASDSMRIEGRAPFVRESSRCLLAPVATHRGRFVMITDDAFGHWFAGFVAGEGCFFASTYIRKCDGCRYLKINFQLETRIDDLPILEEIKERLGVGHIYFHKHVSSIWPHAHYMIQNHTHLKNALIPVFEKHPLRAKKRRDFEVWKRIILLRGDSVHIGSKWFELCRLVEQLKTVREPGQSEQGICVDDSYEQLRLGGVLGETHV